MSAKEWVTIKAAKAAVYFPTGTNVRLSWLRSKSSEAKQNISTLVISSANITGNAYSWQTLAEFGTIDGGDKAW